MPVVIITGPPGAGKTTVASRLARSSRLGVHLAADQVFRWVVGGYVPPWMPGTSRQNGTVISATAAAAVQFADGGYDVFADGIIGPWFLPHWLQMAGRGDLRTHMKRLVKVLLLLCLVPSGLGVVVFEERAWLSDPVCLDSCRGRAAGGPGQGARSARRTTPQAALTRAGGSR